MNRNYAYTVNEIIEFIEKYFQVNHYKNYGNNLITSEFSIINTDIDIILKYFDNDMRVFDITMFTVSGGWEYKRTYMRIEMDVCEKQNRYDYWLQNPGDISIDMYSLKKSGVLPEITKEEIFDKILDFFNRTCKKEQLRDIKLVSLGI